MNSPRPTVRRTRENLERASSEFDRQLEHLVDLHYPRLLGMSVANFRKEVSVLRDLVPPMAPGDVDPSAVPFVLVVADDYLLPSDAVPLLRLGKQSGFIDPNTDDLDDFEPLRTVKLPPTPFYLAMDIDTGSEFCGAVPDNALATIAKRRRLPLTIAEGIALVTQFPQTLRRNECFSLGGSRRYFDDATDRRVPALWISARAPKLGWCWAGNPHTWLGVASLRRRMYT